MKIPDPLLPLFEVGVITEVVRPLMAGKEASVYIVQSQGELRVAKVYKNAQERSFRQRSQYSEGRNVRNSRQRRAMAKGSRYGKKLLEEAWQNAEVDALFRLHAAGVRVPIPYHFSDDVLVMELVTDADGQPAPRLYDVRPEPEEAMAIHKYLIRQVVIMLCDGMVHGDLSEYNILMSGDGPVVIDLPQACDAAHNRNAAKLLKRDVRNLAMFLGRFAPKLRRTRFGPEMWALYERGDLCPDTELTGRFARRVEQSDTAAVLEEIAAAAAEAADKPMSAYRAKKEKKRQEVIAEAERERARQEKREARRKAQAEREAQEPPRAPRPDDPPKRRRRRRRRRKGSPGNTKS
jgi:RIO kinase 1